MAVMWSMVAAIGAGAALLCEALLRSGTLTTAMAVHGTLMIMAWGALLPLGGIVARYFKVTPRQRYPVELDNPFWWVWHRGLQYGGIAVATIALGVILSETHGRFDTPHAWCGLTVMSVGWLQVASALLRGSKGGPTDEGARVDNPGTWRGDHYDMTARRRLFEGWHKRAGWAVLALAAVTMLLGADLAGAPTWLFGVLGLLGAALLLAVVDGHARHRWIDTYLALWGSDPSHPGNRP